MVGMTPHPQRPVALAARIDSFREPEAAFVEVPVRGAGCLVKVTHASVGSTDIMARRGDYLLHPFAGFTPGYDVVGVIEEVDRSAAKFGLAVGDRVAAVLPHMGGHATRIRAKAAYLVPVPPGLPSAAAATLPLDAITAQHALDLLGGRLQTVFINGVSGAVGLLAAQLARLNGARVAGTASPASAAVAQQYGVTTFHYRDERWPDLLRAEMGLVSGVIDHTGDRNLRAIAARDGRIVRTAFAGKTGHLKAATARGFGRTLTHRFARPSEILCSAPMYVATRRRAYRRDLSQLLYLAASGQLRPLSPVVFDADHYGDALLAAQGAMPGSKAVIEFGD